MSPTLTFTAPPPGLAPLHDFTLNPIDGAAGLFSLRAVAEPGRRLFVLDAAAHFPDYTPELSDAQTAELSLASAEEAQVLLIVNPSAAGTTVNLMAPIVVNTTTFRCSQVILDGQDWPLRAPLGQTAA
ncbi:MAG: flagellar assembly protein FliW [Actinomycetales bacterium]|jgi:flagellar assembly factor FliW